MERYFYLPFGSGNLAKPVREFAPVETEVASAPAVQAPEPVAEPKPEEAVNIDAILNAKEADLDALVAELGIV